MRHDIATGKLSIYSLPSYLLQRYSIAQCVKQTSHEADRHANFHTYLHSTVSLALRWIHLVSVGTQGTLGPLRVKIWNAICTIGSRDTAGSARGSRTRLNFRLIKMAEVTLINLGYCKIRKLFRFFYDWPQP